MHSMALRVARVGIGGVEEGGERARRRTSGVGAYRWGGERDAADRLARAEGGQDTWDHVEDLEVVHGAWSGREQSRAWKVLDDQDKSACCWWAQRDASIDREHTRCCCEDLALCQRTICKWTERSARWDTRIRGDLADANEQASVVEKRG